LADVIQLRPVSEPTGARGHHNDRFEVRSRVVVRRLHMSHTTLLDGFNRSHHQHNRLPPNAQPPFSSGGLCLFAQLVASSCFFFVSLWTYSPLFLWFPAFLPLDNVEPPPLLLRYYNDDNESIHSNSAHVPVTFRGRPDMETTFNRGDALPTLVLFDGMSRWWKRPKDRGRGRADYRCWIYRPHDDDDD
jgi:hypothetical protein